MIKIFTLILTVFLIMTTYLYAGNTSSSEGRYISDLSMPNYFGRPDHIFSLSIFNNVIDRDSSVSRTNDTPTLKWYTMIEKIPGDWVTCWDLTVQKENIPMMVGICGLTAALIAADYPICDNSKHFYESSPHVKNVSDFFVYLSDGKPQFGLSAVFAASGLIVNNDRALRTGSQITETILACGAVIQVLKHITGRESPLVSTKRNGRWDFFPNQIQYHKHVPHYDAFPSGHIATSLATLTVILENYPEIKPWLQPLGYAIVGCIGVSLCNKGIHWWSDYPLGLYLGYQFGMIASHPTTSTIGSQNNNANPKFAIFPSILPRGCGVTLSYRP